MLPTRTLTRLTAAAAAGALLLTACGGSSKVGSEGPATSATGSATMIDAARCAANRAAGTINYLSGFQWSATVGTIDVAAAAANGWYRDLCVDVSLHAGDGDAPAAAATVASGTTQIAEVGGASDVLTAAAGGAKIEAIATYGNVFAITLITMATVTSLQQLEGHTLGYKGAMPPEITAMLEHLGVDPSKIKEVGVGYDPTILPRGQVQALTGYKSNEVPTLQGDGYKITSWDPDAYGIDGTFNSFITSPAFAGAHPTAVEDFLRATLHAYAWCHANIGSCLADEQKLSPTGFELPVEAKRWSVESGLVDSHLLAGAGVGAESAAQFQPELSLLLRAKLISSAPALSAVVAPQYVAAVERDGQVTWPAP